MMFDVKQFKTLDMYGLACNLQVMQNVELPGRHDI